MSFPRKNETARIYRDKDKQSYFIVYPGKDGRFVGSMEAIANALTGPEPSLCGTSINSNYIASNWLKRMQWNELPIDYQQAFMQYYNVDDTLIPQSVRGFWRLEKKA